MAFTTRDGRTATQLSEINMIPFIDIMLVLLVIFMISAPVIQSGIDIQVPVTQTVRELDELRIVIQMDRDQTLYLQNNPVNINELVGRIEALQPDPTRRRVYFMGDTSVPLGSVATVLDRLVAAGIDNVSIVTRPAGE
jgi:biopolymer transport protein ExbD/biopolymer transport protein TolR